MAAPHRELKRAAVPNAMGHVVLAFAERTLRPGELGGLRDQLWRTQTYLYVTPGPLIIHRALEGFPPVVKNYPRYRGWVTASFLRQGDHANVVEFFADIPTNFRDTSELTPLIAAHFAPLIDGSPFPDDFDGALAAGEYELARFQRSL